MGLARVPVQAADAGPMLLFLIPSTVETSDHGHKALVEDFAAPVIIYNN